jgi:hypothetical protein
MECAMQISRNMNSIRLILVAGIVALFALVPVGTAMAQSSSAAVTGNVADSTGAKVRGAKVLLINVDTNVIRTTASNGVGDYNFVDVPPANYTLTVTAPSFQTERVEPFQVAVDQKVNINVSLKVGSADVSVTVEAVGTQVESTTSQLGTVMSTTEVNDLPLNGRNFTQLLELTPGATPISTGQNSSASNTANANGDQYIMPSINGQTNRSTYFMLDGLNDTNNWYNTYAIPPIIDTIQEFKINSHNDAQYGGVTGGVVNLVTKSGTNSIHGSGWEFVRNNLLDAIPWVPPSAASVYRINQFGGQVGGPVTIPHLYDGRDKTFLEIGYEGFHKTQNGSSVYLIPTAAQMAESSWGSGINLPYADFSSATTGITSGGTCFAGDTKVEAYPCQLFDPSGSNNANSNRPAYMGNQIPASELDPRAVAFINAIFPAPTTVPGYAFTAENGEIVALTNYHTYNWVARLDEHIGTKDFLFARYNGWQEKTVGPGGVPHLLSYSQLPAFQYGVSWMHVFNPSLSMQVQYGRTHVTYNSYALFDTPAALNAYQASSAFAGNFVGGITLMPNLSVSGGQNGFGAGENSSPAPNEANTHEWQGSVSKTIGRHTLQAGGGWDEINYGETIRNDTVTFSGSQTANFSGNPINSTAGLTTA